MNVVCLQSASWFSCKHEIDWNECCDLSITILSKNEMRGWIIIKRGEGVTNSWSSIAYFAWTNTTNWTWPGIPLKRNLLKKRKECVKRIEEKNERKVGKQECNRIRIPFSLLWFPPPPPSSTSTTSTTTRIPDKSHGWRGWLQISFLSYMKAQQKLSDIPLSL